jgi:photosystem II stability/assembly factor-like uncharacterized protein
MSFPTAQRGFASVLHCTAVHCFVDIETTTDGGVTWRQFSRLARSLNPQVPPFALGPTSETTNDLWFANDQDGVLFAQSRNLLVTHDGGRAWSSVRTPGVVIQALSLGREFVLVVDECSPSNNSYPACGRSELVTVPFGSVAVASTRRLPSCVAENPGNDVISIGGTLMVAGCHALFRSENGGATWEGDQLPFKCEPLLIAADRPSDIWAMCTFMLGAGAQEKWIYRSLDGGGTWKLLSRATLPLGRNDRPIGKVPMQGYAFMLVATSPLHAVLISDRSAVSATFDGGKNWVSPSSAEVLSDGPNAGSCIGPEDCWAGGGAAIMRTTNGGRSWTAVKDG